jgi:pilus assembly protein CpaB
MKRSLVAALAAVFLAIIGCGAVLLYVKGADNRALEGKQAVQVLIATKRIPAGTTGARIRTGGYVESVAMPKLAVPADAMSSIDSSLDALVVTADLQPRQLLLRGSFDEPARVSGGIALPEGKLAVSVQLGVTEGVAGYVRPGAKIAIFDTFTADAKRMPSGERAGQKQPDAGVAFGPGVSHVTRILLPKVEVIAVGSAAAASASKADAAKSDPQSANTLMVTVAVSQEEAERLVHAVQTGALYLALLDDSSNVTAGPGVDNKSLFP